MSPTNAITAEGLVKIYKSRKSEVRALDGVDLEQGDGGRVVDEGGPRRIVVGHLVQRRIAIRRRATA